MQPWFCVATTCPKLDTGTLSPAVFTLILSNIEMLIFPGFRFSSVIWDALSMASKPFSMDSRSISLAFARDCLILSFYLASYSFWSFFLLFFPLANVYRGSMVSPSLGEFHKGCSLLANVIPTDLSIDLFTIIKLLGNMEIATILL